MPDWLSLMIQAPAKCVGLLIYLFYHGWASSCVKM